MKLVQLICMKSFVPEIQVTPVVCSAGECLHPCPHAVSDLYNRLLQCFFFFLLGVKECCPLQITARAESPTVLMLRFFFLQPMEIIHSKPARLRDFRCHPPRSSADLDPDVDSMLFKEFPG